MLFIAFICTYSCTYNQESRRDKTIYYKKGNNYLVPYFLNGKDTIYDGAAEYFYPSGIKSDEIPYIMNSVNGWKLHYDSSGNLISKIMCKNNLANGTGFFYNKKGNIDSKVYYYNDKLFFTTWFYPNGKVRAYGAMNDTLQFYNVEFDLKGNKKLEKGYALSISNDCFSSNLDSIKVNKDIIAIIPIAAIPGYSSAVSVAKFDFSGNMIGDVEVAPISRYFAFYKTKFEKPGKYQFGITGQLKNEKGLILRNDTLYVKLNVKQ